MQIDANQMLSYGEWLFSGMGLLAGLILVISLSIIGFVVSYLIAMSRLGPGEGFYAVSEVIATFFTQDLPKSSFGRTVAIARLAIQEAIRRKVLAVLAVFLIAMLFAGWFIDPNAEDPAKLYIAFTMSAINYLMLPLGLFISAFSIPADIKNRTIYTIITKPVRATEIIFGRMLGFTVVGTVMLLVMGLLSYVFVVRGIRHSHEVETIAASGAEGKLTFDNRHSHTFTLNPDGTGFTNEAKGHRHLVTAVQEGGETTYVIGEPEGALRARVPVFGVLRFTNRDGTRGSGINVGYESTYRKYIEGGSGSIAIWTFENVTPERFGEILSLEMTITAYRTFKGDIETGVSGEVNLRRPIKIPAEGLGPNDRIDEKSSVESERIPFIVKEFQNDQISVSRKLKGTKEGKPVEELDIYQDLVDEDGRLEVVIRCKDQGQYYGMAPADLYLKAGESYFGWNFFKGFVGIWCQMVIIISLGVMFSTFLTGPVAMVATIACIGLGFFGSLANDVLTKKQEGGGPIESIIRLATQSSMTTTLDTGDTTVEIVIDRVDSAIMFTLVAMTSALPDFGSFNTSDYVAYGVNIYGDLVFRHLTMTLGYLILTTIIGYFFLKTREFAA